MQTLKERFWGQVYKDGPVLVGMDSACWQWTGVRIKRGYGRIKKDRKSVLATHVSMELAGIDVPSGMCCCHKCDNPSCVNPDHIFIGTQKDNVRDAAKKDKMSRHGDQNGTRKRPESRPKGEENGRSKLTEHDARFIFKHRHLPLELLAKTFGVSVSTVSKINLQKTWKHLHLHN